jgi:Mce-associated membrane protein
MTSADSHTGTDTGSDVGTETGPDTESGSDVETAAEQPAEPAEKPERASQWPVIALSVSIALAVAAAAVAVWFGIAWFQASNDDGLAYSSKRDEVDRVARAAIVTMNTLDYRKLDEGLSNWADTTTGPLHDEIANLTADKKKQLTDAKPVTSAKITSSAVKELDDRGGKATVIAAIEKTVSTADGKPQPSYQRIQATLTRTKDGWKLENLGPVPYAQPQ